MWTISGSEIGTPVCSVACINISHGSVATRLRSSRIFHDYLITNLLQSLSVESRSVFGEVIDNCIVCLRFGLTVFIIVFGTGCSPSVLGPLLYILYTAELEHVVTQHGMRLHQYADDSQLHLHLTVSDTVVAVQCFSACVSNVNDWMRASRLRLNPAKTEVMWL